MAKSIDMIGQRYGRLLVVKLADRRGGMNEAYWECLCDCGNTHIAARGNLRFGSVKSCGCLARETASRLLKATKPAKRHGLSSEDHSPAYYRFRKYGIKPDFFDDLLDYQQDSCLICLKRFLYTSRDDSPCLDHNHANNQIRGILCRKCNTAIGQVGESVQVMKKAILYLENDWSLSEENDRRATPEYIHSGEIQRRKTHCPQGHEYTKGNTIITGNGGRSCRMCENARSRRFYYRQQEAKVPHSPMAC